LGASRPAFYHLLHDEIGFNCDDVDLDEEEKK
jgi:hypothetical protein